MTFKRIVPIALVTVLALIAGLFVGALMSPANADEAITVPSEYCEADTTPEGQWTDGEWYNWTGGPVDSAPAIDADGWHGPLPKTPKGVPHNAEPGVYSTSDKGKASYFKHTAEWVEGEVIPGVCDVWVTWMTPTWAPDANDANDVGWPQTFVQFGQGQPTECEVTYQIDRYQGSRADIEDVIGDGTLTGYPPAEDADIVTDWYFASTEACPTPVAVVFDIEPNAPTCLADGSLPELPAREGYVLQFRESPDGPHTYTLVATLLEGYEWTDGTTEPKTTKVTVLPQLTGPVACPVDTPPTPEPTVTPKPSPEPTPSVTPEPEPTVTPEPEPETPDAPKPSPARGVPTYTG